MARRRVLSFLLAPKVLAITLGGVLFVVGCLALLFFWLSRWRLLAGVGWDVAVFSAGVLVGGLVLGVWHLAATGSGAASWYIGAETERTTARALERLGRSWQLVHGVPFVEGPSGHRFEVDVDHVAVGPGGVLVVETKFHSSPLGLGAPRLAKRLRDDAAQASRNAQLVRNLLRDVAPGASVVPVLVY